MVLKNFAVHLIGESKLRITHNDEALYEGTAGKLLTYGTQKRSAKLVDGATQDEVDYQ